jgi:hypothetical protein
VIIYYKRENDLDFFCIYSTLFASLYVLVRRGKDQNRRHENKIMIIFGSYDL